MNTQYHKLLSAEDCINEIFDGDTSPPSIRTWKQWQYDGLIPFVKVKGKVFFSPEEVYTALTKNFTRKESM